MTTAAFLSPEEEQEFMASWWGPAPPKPTKPPQVFYSPGQPRDEQGRWSGGASYGFHQDNPLAEAKTSIERQRAQEWLDENPHTPTAWFNEDVPMDPKKVSTLPGLRGEEKRIDPAKVAKLAESMRAKGWDGFPIQLEVDRHGRLGIYEGNHRARAAVEAGLDKIPARVNWLGGGETILPPSLLLSRMGAETKQFAEAPWQTRNYQPRIQDNLRRAADAAEAALYDLTAMMVGKAIASLAENEAFGFSETWAFYSRDQPRDARGRWSKAGGWSASKTLDWYETDRAYTEVLHGTKESFATVNNQLRSGRPLNAEQEELVAAMDRTMKPLGLPMTLFRGVDELTADALKPGTVVRDRGFVSTTKLEGTAAGFAASHVGGRVLTIQAPESTKAADLDAVHGRILAQEVVLARDTRFRVTAKDTLEVVS